MNEHKNAAEFVGCLECLNTFGQFDDELGTVVDCDVCRREVEADLFERAEW